MLDLWLELEGSQLTRQDHISSLKRSTGRINYRNLPYREWKLFLTNYMRKESQQSGLPLDGILILFGSSQSLSNRKIIGDEMDTKKIQEAVKMIIETVGEDGNREDF